MTRKCGISGFIALLGLITSGSLPAAPSEYSAAALGKLLAGHYDNATQVAAGKQTIGGHPPQHVTVTIEPTRLAHWQLWRVHMDVDPAVAKAADAATSLDAVWAMKISTAVDGKSLQIVPYTVESSVDEASVKATTFDKSQWRPLEGCALIVETEKPRMIAMTPPQEMCVAETMSLGGRRAFLPSWVERDGDMLGVQLIYFGAPWRVEAKRTTG